MYNCFIMSFSLFVCLLFFFAVFCDIENISRDRIKKNICDVMMKRKKNHDIDI